MSTYEYTSTNGRRSLMVESAATEPDSVFVSAGHKSYPMSGIWIPNADVPTVAAELLKAAGHDYLAGYIEGDIDHRERLAEKAEVDAAEKKLQERRDILARQFTKDVNGDYIGYNGCGPYTRAAIDAYIATEDGASRD